MRKKKAPDPAEKSKQAAKEAGLRYVSPAQPGIRRVKAGKSFAYLSPQGKRVTDEKTLARIRSLVIPPAWRDVWICTDPQGHLQVLGRDARGRNQYRYHPRWREVRDENKYGRLIAFAKVLPKIRARTRRDLAKPGLPREKVLATVVQLLEKTLIRVGNEEYAKLNDSYGLTTLQDKHAKVQGGKVRFQFRGKSGVSHQIELDDPRLAKIVKACQELPGHELLQYVDDDGTVHDVGSEDVNKYLHEIAGEEFTAKDFRTWVGTVLAAHALQELHSFDSQAEAKRNIVSAIETVAERLGNTKAVCRKCYVHPEVLNAYLDGSLVSTLQQRAAVMAKSLGKLSPEEAAVLTLLQRRLAQAKKPLASQLADSIKRLRKKRPL
ncbi:MAG: DNA topoisomerase IB [Pseudomonadota bacterium]